MPAANKVLPKAGLNGFDWTFMLKTRPNAKPQTVKLLKNHYFEVLFSEG